jgi:hypothetical protein
MSSFSDNFTVYLIDDTRRSKRSRTAKSFGDDFTVYHMNDTPKTIIEAFVSPDVDD